MTKVMVKVDSKWVHFCYLVDEVHQEFLIGSPFSINDFIKEKIKEEYDIIIETAEDLDKAKRVIYDNYCDLYPEIFTCGYNVTDHIGVSRIWLTQKIRGLNNEN